MEVFSARLKWLRDRKGFSQKEMADLLGVSQPYYFKFEKGTGEPNLETLKKLPEILGESLNFLLGVTDLDSEMDKIMEELTHIGRLTTGSFERFKSLRVQELKADVAGNEKEVTLARYELEDLGAGMAKLFQTAQDISTLARRKMDEIPLMSDENKIALEGISKNKFGEDPEVIKWIEKYLEKKKDPQ